MAGPISSLFVRLGLDAQAFSDGIDEAKYAVAAFAGDTADKLGGLGGRFDGFFSNVKQGFGLAFGFAAQRVVADGYRAVVGFIAESGQKASELEATLRKTRTVFGESAADIEAWGKTAADNFGQSQQDALDAAAAFGGLFESVGAAQDEAAAKGKKLTELGADLAAFFGGDVKSAIGALRSGLQGQTEPLRKYNVFLSDAAVNAELLKEGEKKVAGQWSESQKVMGRYKIIMDQTKTVQGEFGRSSDDLRVKQEKLNAKLDNVQATLGEKVLPAQLAVNEALLAAVVAIDGFVSSYDDAKQHFVEGPKKTFLDSMPSRQEVEAALADLENIRFVSPFQQTLFDFNAFGVKDTWQKQIDDLNAYLQRTAFTDTGRAITEGLSPGKDALDSYMAFLTGRIPTGFDAAATAAKSAAKGGLTSLWQQLKDDKEQADYLYSAMDRLATDVLDDEFGGRIQAGRLAELKQQLIDLQTEQGKFTDGSSDWVILDGKIAGVQQSIGEVEGEMAKAAGNDAYAAWLKTQIDRMEKAGENADAYRDALIALRRTINSMTDIKNSGSVGGINPLTGKPWGVRAHGGPVKAGEGYIVGENQPEFFVPKTDGTILPEVPRRSSGMPWSSSGATITINGGIHVQVPPGTTDPRALATALADALGEEVGYQTRRFSEAPRY